MVPIVDLCRVPFTPEVLRRVSAVLDERPAAIARAVAGAAPAILTGVLDTASTPAGMDRVRAMVRESRSMGGRLDDLGGLLEDRSEGDAVMRGGLRLASTLFGNRLDGITEALAGHSGLRSGAASSLLSLVVSIIMSVLARLAASDGVGFAGLMGQLRAQRSTVAGAIPRGVATALGFGDEGRGPRMPSGRAPRSGRAARPRERRRPGRPEQPGLRSLRPFLVAGAGALVLVAVLGHPRTLEIVTGGAGVLPAHTTDEAAATVRPAPEPAAGSPVAFVKESPRSAREAPDALQHAAALLRGASVPEDPRRFVLGDFSFESGSARLTEESAETLDALATVLRANPTVEIALEGHTDSTGDAAANQVLSAARASAIEDGFVQAGVPRERITAAGYGPHRPVASNDTEDGRARNRRTEVVVVHQ